ncbi:MAG: DUF3536 domain-containing protein [Deltaproteobacteria bacterium]|nr:DUF3536 domain-containing protein [Deltaproteobacteria bacterium]MBZ0219468.1 DUF3536 domain-containing protein [Deltaproteobacteria bacterium]
MEKYICIHGHFYQPPRENPWLERIELQDSAHPYHDWNQRITEECYEPNSAARILGPDLKIIEITNNYSKISFNFGPTLLYNMQTDSPEVYRNVIEADRMSMDGNGGRGSAIAQVYNHMIMPLATRTDKRTQAVWGIRDFKARFGRDPEGMWLPETAVDIETLEVLSELGMKFTILAPRQARRVRKTAKGARWKELSGEDVDTTIPYLCLLPSGRSIALFFYNGQISRDVGFGNLLDNGENFAMRLEDAFPPDDGREAALVHIATDGESYGHHHRHGDMALSYCLYHIETKGLAKLTNYGEYLEKFPPENLVEIHENSSWSCVHGVERWRADCGCNTGGYPLWNQSWRGPLREAFDWLRDTLAPVYEREASALLKDPWAARDAYIDVINDRSRERVEAFFAKHAAGQLGNGEKVRALKLLEMQRNSQLMYTSCGWFFDEVSGIEGVQVMMYASMAMQLAEEAAGVSLESGFEGRLERTPSNVFGNARNAYDRFVRASSVDLLRVGAHHAISSLFEEYSKKTSIYAFEAENEFYEKIESGKHKLALGKTVIRSKVSWEEAQLSSAVLHLGEMSVNCGIRFFRSEEEFMLAEQELKSAFDRGDIPEVIRLMDRHFGAANYSLWHLFRDEQRKIVNEILHLTSRDIEGFHRHIFESNFGTMDFLRKLGVPLPRPLGVSAEFILNHDLEAVLKEKELNLEKFRGIIKKSRHLAVQIDQENIGYFASAWITGRMEEVRGDSMKLEEIEKLREALKLLRTTPVKLKLWKAQNLYFALGRKVLAVAREKAAEGDEASRRWVEAFEDLGNYFHVSVS